MLTVMMNPSFPDPTASAAPSTPTPSKPPALPDVVGPSGSCNRSGSTGLGMSQAQAQAHFWASPPSSSAVTAAEAELLGASSTASAFANSANPYYCYDSRLQGGPGPSSSHQSGSSSAAAAAAAADSKFRPFWSSGYDLGSAAMGPSTPGSAAAEMYAANAAYAAANPSHWPYAAAYRQPASYEPFAAFQSPATASAYPNAMLAAPPSLADVSHHPAQFASGKPASSSSSACPP